MARVQEYRLRAFEKCYVKPHVQFFEKHHGRNWPDHIDQADWARLPSEWFLRIFLLREASNWINMGRQHGYFSQDLVPISESFGFVKSDRLLLEPGRHMGFTRVDSVWKEDWGAASLQPTFDQELVVAMQDLTDDNMEFLRLFFFSNDKEWEHKIAELAAVSQALERGERVLPVEFMDKVMWALQGPETAMTAWTMFPSWWRSNPLSHDVGDRESARMTPLNHHRDAIKRDAKRMIISDYQHRLAQGRRDEWGSPEGLGTNVTDFSEAAEAASHESFAILSFIPGEGESDEGFTIVMSESEPEFSDAGEELTDEANAESDDFVAMKRTDDDVEQ